MVRIENNGTCFRMSLLSNQIKKKMFFSIFFSFSFSASSADLAAPFSIDAENKIGYWELGGSSVSEENYILLVPPIQNRKGCVWTNVEIPKKDVWEIKVTFQIPHAEGGSFGLWFVSQYAQDGTFCGGPNVFKGAALVGQIVRNRDHGIGLALSFLQSDGHKQFRDFAAEPDIYFDIHRRTPVWITVRYDNGYFKFYSNFADQTEGGEENFLFEKKINVDISDNYIGFTAQNERLVMNMNLISIEFNINMPNKSTGKRDRSMGNRKPSSQFTPNTIYRLRNPAFNKTIIEIEKQEKDGNAIKEGATANEIFDIIEEINVASFDVASFSELNSFVKNNIMNYSLKWQRRTLRLVDRVRNTRNVAGAALNYTTAIMETFRDQMQTTLSKTNEKFADLYSLLGEFGGRGIDVNNDMHQMVDDINKRSIVTWLAYAAVAEVLGIIILLISANTCMKKHVYGSNLR